ncbi:unnamed protein product [Caenorhabditis sp. 36 PRJEB53466]|nr:unnamed protein product [Caenorhabditis sp. 36 PRJEB53466]
MSNRDGLHPFFRSLLSPDPVPSRGTPRVIYDRSMRTPTSEPIYNPWSDITAGFDRQSRFMQQMTSSERTSRRVLPPPPRSRQSQLIRVQPPNSLLNPLFPLDPPSPIESEQVTPAHSPRNSPSPSRSPVRNLKHYNPIPPPNSPVEGVPKNQSRRCEDAINMGFGFAESWIDTLKPSRAEAEERIELPMIYWPVKRKTLVMLVAHKNVDETLFHNIEVPFVTEKKMKEALSEKFKLIVPVHRIRLRISEVAEVPLTQDMIDRFEPVEYFRLNTTCPNKWLLHQIVNYRLYRT